MPRPSRILAIPRNRITSIVEVCNDRTPRCATEAIPRNCGSTAAAAASHLRSRFLLELHDPIPPRSVCHLLPRSAREVLKRPSSETSAFTHRCYSYSTVVKIASLLTYPATATVIEMLKRFHPGVHERHTLMNFERARKHSLIAQFDVHVDTNIGLAARRKYNEGVARGTWMLLRPTIASLQRKIVRINRIIWENDTREPYGRERSFNYVNTECLNLQCNSQLRHANAKYTRPWYFAHWSRATRNDFLSFPGWWL